MDAGISSLELGGKMRVVSFLDMFKITHFFIFVLDKNKNVIKIKVTQKDFLKVLIFHTGFLCGPYIM